MKKYKILIITITLLILVLGFFYWKNQVEENYVNKVVFIDNLKLFEEFQMKKDFDLLIEKDLIVESRKLDSIGAIVSKMDQNPLTPAPILAQNKQVYFSLKQLFEEKYQKLAKNYTAQVYERLNAYLNEYGKLHEIRLIVGGSGQGNVMFVNENADITDEVLQYVNKKYLDN